ncbi:uncharacterized protein N7477_005484 [Penicillium maclennaniae]|uniref:uncharacterized protein n=1 Tax=Penicillium maclennaniae TaxID=1343394 RepID=UPI00253FB004|nr:uncharacterized protein N7477_005484 [Penicillium maclennaniae]KAJ5670121.1 hypothetical protein N7477_005484 [Penicillium maclennaniae]
MQRQPPTRPLAFARDNSRQHEKESQYTYFQGFINSIGNGQTVERWLDDFDVIFSNSQEHIMISS